MLIGVILAGGKSQRMGEDKAALVMDGQTMLDRMLSIMSQTHVSKIVINHNDISTLQAKSAGRQYDPGQPFADIIPNKGPLSGIHSALVNFPDAHLLIVPVDMPFIKAQSLNGLISEAQLKKTNARFDLIRPSETSAKQSKSYTLPLYIQNNCEVRQKLEQALLKTSTYSVYHFCSLFPILQVPIENEHELVNLNYPEQLSQFTKGLKK